MLANFQKLERALTTWRFRISLNILTCLKSMCCAVLSCFSHVWHFVTPVDCSLPGFSVLGILQARILEWIAIAFSRGSSQPRDWTQVVDRCFTIWATLTCSDGRASVYNEGDPCSIPGLGRSSGEGNGNPLQYYCLENPHGQRSLGATVHGVKTVSHSWVIKHSTGQWNSFKCLK